MAVVAIKDIAEGDEILTSYGVGAWLLHAELLTNRGAEADES